MAHPPNYSFGFAAKTVCLSTAFRESDDVASSFCVRYWPKINESHNAWTFRAQTQTPNGKPYLISKP